MKYYRVTAPARIEFRSDPLGEGQRDTPEWAHGQFQDVVRLLNKEGIDEWSTGLKVYPDFAAATVELVDDEDE